MIRNLKTLGLAIVAVFAMSAVVASAASASEFTASSYSGGTTATASSPIGNDDFKTEAGSVECKTHYHVGPLNGPSESISVTETSSECKAFGFLSATITRFGCFRTFHPNGNIATEACIKETIHAGTCTIEVPAQSGLSKVDLSSNGSDITMQMTITGIKYNVTKDGFGCPFGGTGAKTGATFTQNAPVTITGNGGRTISIS